GPAQPFPPHGHKGSPGAHPVWYGETPRAHRASRGRHAARCQAPHSPRLTAARGRGECPAVAGTQRHSSPAGRPGRLRVAGRGPVALEWTHMVLRALKNAAWRLPLAAWKASVAAGDDVMRAAGGLQA